MTVKKTQQTLNTTLEKTEQSLNGLETALENNVGGRATGEHSEGGENNTGLPEGWLYACFESISAIEKNALKAGPFGSALKKSDSVSEGYKVYGQEQVIAGNEGLDTYFISSEKYEQLKSCAVKPGDILISLVGTVGKVLILTSKSQEGVINPRLVKLSLFPDVSRVYIKEYLGSPVAKGFYKSFSHGGTMEILNLKILKQLQIPLPPLAEQTVMAQTLDTLLAQVDNIKTRLDAIPKILITFRQSVLAAAVSGKLTEAWRLKHPDNKEDLLGEIKSYRVQNWKLKGKYKEPAEISDYPLPELPDSWQVCSLDMLVDVNKPICYGILMPKDNLVDGVLYVKVRDMKGNVIDLSGLQRTSQEIAKKYERSILLAGDILVSIRGTYGRVVVVPPFLAGGNITQDSARVSTCNQVNRDYLVSVLRSPELQAYFKTVARGVAVKGVNIGDLRPTPIPLPPKVEQTEIVRRVEELFAFADQIEQQVQNAQGRVNNLTQSILAKAFRGELTTQWRVENPDLITGDNSAEALLAKIQAERDALKKSSKPKKKSTAKKTTRKVVK